MNSRSNKNHKETVGAMKKYANNQFKLRLPSVPIDSAKTTDRGISSKNQITRRSSLSSNAPITQENPLDRNRVGIVESIEKIERLMETRRRTKEERAQEFIYQKLSKNKLRYTEKSKINTNALPINKGTISLMLNHKKKETDFDVNAFKTKLPKRSRFKLKWKTIQWLVENKKEQIHQLCESYSLFLKFFKNKAEGVSKADFFDLLTYVGLGGEKSLAEKLYYVFDDDNNGSIDYKELIMGLELFRNNTYEDKMKVFFELCDPQNTGIINMRTLYEVLKKNIVSDDDKIKLKRTLNNIFSHLERSKVGKISKKELLQIILKNDDIRILLDENIKKLRRIDKIIDNDLEEPFATAVPMGSNNLQQHEGVHYPMNRKLLDMIEINEKIKFEHKMRKQEQMEEARKIQAYGDNYEHSDSDS